VHHLDFFDVCAVLLGIYFTIAKLDAQGRRHEAFPHVSAADFERWRNWTVSVYRLGSSICFLRVVFHQAWAFYLNRQALTSPVAPRALMYPALAMDLVFFTTIVVTFIRASRVRKLRRELGIVLTPLTPNAQAAAAPDEAQSGTNDDNADRAQT